MEPRRVAPVLGLCALLAADAVLIGWAFRGAPVDDPALSTTRVASSSSPPVTPSGGTSTAPSAPVKVAPVARFVAPVGPGVAWVLEAGSCAKPGTIWATSDGGDTWSRNTTPGRMMRARPRSADGGTVIGGDRECRLRAWATNDAGKVWGGARPADTFWSRDPDDARRVHLPDNETTRPCGDGDVVDLATLDSTAAVLCENGEVRRSTDGGKEWPSDFVDRSALAIGIDTLGRGVLVRTQKDCEGVVAVALEDSQPSARKSCLEVPPVEGKVSVGTTGTAWWLVVGDVVLRSENAVGPWSRTGAPLPSG